MKTTPDSLARFGGRPMFDRPRPTGQIHTPDRDRFLARLDRIIEGRRYSNGGPQVEELEARLARDHDVRHLLTFANASLALIALMRHCALPGAGEILLPSFSYRGLPHFVQWAGKTPRFVEVDPVTHALSEETVAPEIERGNVSAILAVNNVSAPADLAGLRRISEATGIPVIYDSVYAIAAEFDGRPFGENGVAEVFSLHATKLVNGFEGGYVATNDDALAETLRQLRNFGYDNKSPEIRCLGMNGKLNEIHAAMALTSLEELDGALGHNRAIIATYRKALADTHGVRILDPVDGMVPNDEMVLMEVSPDLGIGRDDLLLLLQAEGALARPYFSPPLHRSRNCPPEARGARLPVTDDLATRFVQLPTGAFVTAGDAESIAGTITMILGHADEVAARLTAQQGECG